MTTVIEVAGLSKRYVLGRKKEDQHTSLRDVISSGAKAVGARLRSPFTSGATSVPTDAFWALRDLDFKIEQGARVGIIGRNGAGKSTLLKVLSRITEPTAGRISIRGRVASLLEVGTGFHPELTGRENIYLNGAILGMSKVEIKRKFDEIVDFAGVDKFLDTPVKRYSSGMYVRLAFAVAAHLEPEILIVDEVLAVGDAEFQKKCLGRMEAVGKEGRTVIFVSHNLNAVEQLCTSALRLRAGTLADHGRDVRQVIKGYLSDAGGGAAGTEWTYAPSTPMHANFGVTRLAITDRGGQTLDSPLRNDSDAWIRIEGNIQQLDPALQVGYGVFSDSEQLLYLTTTLDVEESRWAKPTLGSNVFACRFPARLLNEGSYRIDLFAALPSRQWVSRPGYDAPSIRFEVQGGLSDSSQWMSRRDGEFAPVFEWRHEPGVALR